MAIKDKFPWKVWYRAHIWNQNYIYSKVKSISKYTVPKIFVNKISAEVVFEYSNCGNFCS